MRSNGARNRPTIAIELSGTHARSAALVKIARRTDPQLTVRLQPGSTTA